MVPGHSLSYGWKGQASSLLSALLSALDVPNRLGPLLQVALDGPLPQALRDFCTALSTSEPDLAALRDEGLRLLAEARAQQVESNSEAYCAWLEEASTSQLGALFRAIKSHEQVLERPFQQYDGLRRAFERYEYWASVWTATEQSGECV